MWSSWLGSGVSPPWPGFDSRHGKSAAMSILLHHQVGKKNRFPMLQYVIIFYNFRVETFFPSADCITSTIIVMQFCYRHQHSAGSPMSSNGQDLALSPPWSGFDSRHGKFTAIWYDFLLYQKIREMVHLVYKSSIFVEFNAKNLVSSGAGNILTIILIQLLCCWAENFSLLEGNENFRKERFNFTASNYYPGFDFV